MSKLLSGESFKQMQFEGYKTLRKKYAVSNLGRAASYEKSIKEDGKLISGSVTSGYRTVNLHLEKGNGTLYFHREVARLFCKKKSPAHKFVIHLNHRKADNNFKNLRWVTAEEMAIHQQKSPEKIAYKKRQANRTVGMKLTAQQVKTIKAMLKDPKRKMTIRRIAMKYDVSEMTLYRIKKGENWGRVK